MTRPSAVGALGEKLEGLKAERQKLAGKWFVGSKIAQLDKHIEEVEQQVHQLSRDASRRRALVDARAIFGLDGLDLFAKASENLDVISKVLKEGAPGIEGRIYTLAKAAKKWFALSILRGFAKAMPTPSKFNPEASAYYNLACAWNYSAQAGNKYDHRHALNGARMAAKLGHLKGTAVVDRTLKYLDDLGWDSEDRDCLEEGRACYDEADRVRKEVGASGLSLGGPFQSDYENTYAVLFDDDLVAQFWEFVEEFNSTEDWALCAPLTAMWFEANKRGTSLPDAAQLSPHRACW